MLYLFWAWNQRRGWYVFWVFFKIGLCSAISFKSSRRELSIHMAEHRSILKQYQNTHCPRFSFIPKKGTAFPKRGCHVFLWTRFRFRPLAHATFPYPLTPKPSPPPSFQPTWSLSRANKLVLSRQTYALRQYCVYVKTMVCYNKTILSSQRKCAVLEED